MALAWLTLIHVMGAVGLVMYPWPGWRIFLPAWLLAFAGGAGVTVCLHRAITHRSLKLHPALRELLTFLAVLNGSTAPGTWVPTHRLHHATTDTPDDPSSPAWGGLFRAHLGWTWNAPAPAAKYVLEGEQEYFRIWSHLQVPIFLAGLMLGAPFGWAAFFWLGAIRLAFSVHATEFVSSVCHTQPGAARGADASRNVGWVGLFQFGLGENWHRNHHAHPGCARLGWRWWEIDLGYWLIVALEKCGLASKVRRMPEIRPKAVPNQNG